MPYGFDNYRFDINKFDEKKDSLSLLDVAKLSEIYKNSIDKIRKDNIDINEKLIDKIYKSLMELVNIADRNHISLEKVLEEREFVSDSIVNNVKKDINTDSRISDFLENQATKVLKDKYSITDKVNKKLKYESKRELENIKENHLFNVKHKNNENFKVRDSVKNSTRKPLENSTSVSDFSNRNIKPHPKEKLNVQEYKKFNINYVGNTDVSLEDIIEAKVREIPVIIFINGIKVNFKDFRINDSSNNRISTCSFTVEDPSDTILEICNQRAEVKIILMDKEIYYFGGRIVSNPIKAYGLLKKLTIKVEDYTSESDDFIVTERYSGKITDILESMWKSYYEYGFNVDIYPSDEEIQVRFNYESLFDATEYLVKYLGWNWHVDFDGYTRVLRVFPPKTNIYKETIFQEQLLYETGEFTLDNNIVNAVYFFGGEGKSNFITEKISADGKNNVYKIAYSPIVNEHEFSLYVEGKQQRVGTDSSSEDSNLDVIVNINEKTLQWQEGNAPAEGQEIKIVYKYSYPIVVYMENEASIEQYGKVVKRIEDKKIITVEQARKATEKYLAENSQPKFTGVFKTLEAGIKSGMYINLDLPRYKAVGVFYVAEVELNKQAQLLVKKVKLNKVMDPAAIYASKLKELSNRITNLENDKKENIILQKFKCISQDIILNDNTNLSFERSGSFAFDKGEWDRSDLS